MTDTVELVNLIGEQLQPHLDALAALRIEVFREYPYLYDGDTGYERNYLRTYANAERSFCVLARDGADIVGAATGIPLEDETEEFIAPIQAEGLPVGDIFYFGESVLRRSYRGRGIGAAFMREREAYARELGFRQLMFCSVLRPETHPRKPAGYRPLDAFWESRGFRRHPTLKTWYRWRDLDDHEETLKPMVYWVKTLS
ncbi:MAG: GNAT family N-acetyltransferase [Ectothiorhodospiraceae bacterium]|nr:GNAT family N-acetyltransferase [Ectothiorhodospiraceae bacterium]